MPKFYAYMSLVMGLIFIGFGIAVPFYPPPMFTQLGIKGYMLLVVAVILIMYGTFRISRAMKHLNKK